MTLTCSVCRVRPCPEPAYPDAECIPIACPDCAPSVTSESYALEEIVRETAAKLEAS